MAIVTEYDWESDTFTHHAENAVRQAWRAAVAEIAVKAKGTLPDCAGRVDSAVKLVLAGDVELLDDGQVKVPSQSNGTVVYHIVNGECSCKDWTSGRMPPVALTGGCAIPVPLHQASHRDTLPFRHYNAHVETAPYALSMRKVL